MKRLHKLDWLMIAILTGLVAVCMIAQAAK